MNKILVAIPVSMLLLGSIVFAEAISPALVVKALLEAIQKNSLEDVIRYADLTMIATSAQNPKAPEELVALLKDINQNDVQLTAVQYPGRQERVTVRMERPMSLYFELVLRKAAHQIGKEEDRYVVVSVHP